MQRDLKDIASDELVDMLNKNITYFLSIPRIVEMSKPRKDAKAQIDLILSEIRTREGNEEISGFDVNIKSQQ